MTDPKEEHIDVDFQHENERTETTFDDLSDDILIKIITYLDLPSRLNLRVNKRLDKLFLCAKDKWHAIRVDATYERQHLYIEKSNIFTFRQKYHDVKRLEKLLRLFARNISVKEISVEFFSLAEHGRIIDALSNFKAETIHIKEEPLRLEEALLAEFDGDYPGEADAFFDSRPGLSQVQLSTLFNLAENVRDVTIEMACISISARDFCNFRKAMLEGDYKLEHFTMCVKMEMAKSFMEECFGVTIEEETLERRRTKIFRSANESLELFTKRSHGRADVFGPTVYQFEGALQTSVSRRYLSFTKNCELTDEKYAKIQMNHLYVRE